MADEAPNAKVSLLQAALNKNPSLNKVYLLLSWLTKRGEFVYDKFVQI